MSLPRSIRDHTTFDFGLSESELERYVRLTAEEVKSKEEFERRIGALIEDLATRSQRPEVVRADTAEAALSAELSAKIYALSEPYVKDDPWSRNNT